MAATESAAQPSVPDILERERRARPGVGLAALAAAVLVVVAGVLPQAIYSGFPRVYVIDALRDAAGQAIGRPGLRTAQVLFIDGKAAELLIVAVAQALAALLVGWLLVFLHSAATARGATTPRVGRLLAMVGAVASAVGTLLLQIAVMVDAHQFATSSDHGTPAAHEALRGGAVVAGSGIGFFGGLVLAAAFVMIAIASMRVGLLTRFLGVLGAIVGVLFVIGPATGSSTFIVQTFWLLLVGVLILGRWPGGTPPAWSSGEGMQWPSQQEVREARMARRSDGGRSVRGRDPRAVADEPAASDEAPGRSESARARKKRKRRS